MTVENPSPTATPPAPPAPQPSPQPETRTESGPKNVTCEFCECVLFGTSGNVKTFSEKAKKLRDLHDEFERQAKKLEAANARIAELETPHPPTTQPSKPLPRIGG